MCLACSWLASTSGPPLGWSQPHSARTKSVHSINRVDTFACGACVQVVYDNEEAMHSPQPFSSTMNASGMCLTCPPLGWSQPHSARTKSVHSINRVDTFACGACVQVVYDNEEAMHSPQPFSSTMNASGMCLTCPPLGWSQPHSARTST